LLGGQDEIINESTQNQLQNKKWTVPKADSKKDFLTVPKKDFKTTS
jgi:hypothetical protein